MIVVGDQIPHREFAGDLFSAETVQRTVPFLGAGVSISARISPKEPEPPLPDPRIAAALACLTQEGEPSSANQIKLDSTTQLFAKTALEMAFLIQRMRNESATKLEQDILLRLKSDPYPPSAGELVELLATRAGYESFEEVLIKVSSRLGRQVGAADSKDLLAFLRLAADLVGASSVPLSSISAYFLALRSRDVLLDRLAEILANKRTPTRTHELVACAAKKYLTSPSQEDGSGTQSPPGHYLIITTNYDELMEKALEVPYVVVTMSLKDFQVRARFGNLDASLKKEFEEVNPPRAAKSFALECPPSLTKQRFAIVYKVHGCIREWLQPSTSKVTADTIVISDNDYVTNISRFSHNDGVIPACVSNVLQGEDKPSFLFLGYSLSDWNIRGMLRAIRSKRAGEGNEDEDYGDFAVVRRPSKLDEVFFQQNKIRIAVQDLNDFSSAVMRFQ